MAKDMDSRRGAEHGLDLVAGVAVSRRVRVPPSRVADSSGVSAAEQQRREGCGSPGMVSGNAAGKAAPEVPCGPSFRVQRSPMPQWFKTRAMLGVGSLKVACNA